MSRTANQRIIDRIEVDIGHCFSIDNTDPENPEIKIDNWSLNHNLDAYREAVEQLITDPLLETNTKLENEIVYTRYNQTYQCREFYTKNDSRYREADTQANADVMQSEWDDVNEALTEANTEIETLKIQLTIAQEFGKHEVKHGIGLDV